MATGMLTGKVDIVDGASRNLGRWAKISWETTRQVNAVRRWFPTPDRSASDALRVNQEDWRDDKNA